MGTPDFAVPVLDAIVKEGFHVVGVITVPDKPAGRGKKLRASAIKEYAVAHNLHLLQPEKLRDETFLKELRTLKPDVQIVVAFRMLPKVVWSIPELGTFNLHASLLPQYRGAAPINHAVINGEKVTGVTTFFIDDKIDTGNIILQKTIPIDEQDDFKSLHDKMMIAGAELVLKTINLLLEGDFEPIDQQSKLGENELLKPAPRIFKEDCRIDWNKPVSEIYNFIRGLSPWPVAFTNLKDGSGKEYYVKIFKASPVKEKNIFHPGKVITDNKQYIKVYGLDGYLNIEELQMPGKKRMTTDSLLRGFSFSGEVNVVS